MRGALAPLIALLLGACSAPPPILSGDAHPPLWIAERDGTRIYLLGSVHALPAGVAWEDARVAAAIAASDRLVLELAPAELAAAASLANRMATDESVPPLSARIGSAAAAHLADYVGMDEDDADRTESWSLALRLGNARAASWGLNPAYGVETSLSARFAAASKPVEGLERAVDQLRAFDDIDPALQARGLSLSIADAGDARAKAAALLRAWAAGDTEGIARLADAELARTPWLVEPLVTARNRAWAQRLGNAHGRLLVAVGSGHLVGPNALPTLLAGAGFRVTRL